MDLNLRRAGLVAHPTDWPWSSARAYLGGEDPTGLLNLERWRELWPGNSWEAYLLADDAVADVAPLRYHTQRPGSRGEMRVSLTAWKSCWDVRCGRTTLAVRAIRRHETAPSAVALPIP